MMTISERLGIPDSQAFHKGLSACSSCSERNKLVITHMGWKDISGYQETCSRNIHQFPLLDDCTVVLLHGRIILDDDDRIFSGTNTAVRIKGSKTLTICSNTAVAWNPAPCCWEADACLRAYDGECRRLGIGNVREEKKASWWRKIGEQAGLLKSTEERKVQAMFESIEANTRSYK
ncbi:hypothetical protein F5B19DRAFT_88143 [Rostrohypoxylon terebratum]|nr:hypothetical protein F5B19DRAFT_88143 [Rostrohypoxylon terebratum]